MSAIEKLTEGSATEVTECIAFVSDDQTHSIVHAVLQDYFAEPIVREGSTPQVIEYLSESTAPQVLIVDISDSASPLTAMMSLTAALTDDTRVIGIGTVNDITLYREILDAGVTDYIVKPVTEKALGAALQRTKEQPKTIGADGAAEVRQKRIAVVGTRGGCGSSTLAVNLAWMLGEEQRHKTILVDLDLEFGTTALSLDLEPTRGLREALENPTRIDSLFISSATTKLTENLSVMATEEILSGELQFNPNAVEVLFEIIGRTNDIIVIDLPRPAYAVRERVLEAATHIVLVTELSLPGLRDSIRLLSGIEAAAPDTPVTVVASRTGGPKQAMPSGEFQNALGRKIDFQIPEEPKALNKAANTGKPLVQYDKRSKVSVAIRKIVNAVSDEEGGAKKKKSGGFMGMFKRAK
jgi:pilus assembly protein CpaE